MQVDLPRRWRWALGAGCAFVVGLAVLFVVAARSVEAPRTLDAAAAVPIEETVAMEQAPAVELRAPLAAMADVRGADEVQVCGGAWVRTLPDGSLDPAAFARAAHLPETIARVRARLSASPDEFARAVALALEMFGIDDEQRSAASSDVAGGQATPRPNTGVATARDALARMAAATGSAKVYALAFKACGSGSVRAGACQLISAEQWARLDPTNAMPWQFLLASARTDRAALEEALFRIASAQRSDIGYFDAAGAILAAMPDGDDAKLARWAMASAALGIEATVALPPLQVVTAACRGDALRDANRGQTCAGVAESLSERSDTLIGRAIGVAVGRQIGWPAERSDRMRGEYDAYVSSMAPAVEQAEDLGCARVQRDLDSVQRHARLGEIGSLREWVAQSGRTSEEFIREHRARQQAREAEGEAARREAAASAAAATPIDVAAR